MFSEISESFQQEGIKVPPPNEQVAEWPLIGEKVYAAWSAASNNLETFLSSYEEQLASFGKWLMSTALGIGVGILQFILSIIIAGVLLATKGTDDFTRKMFRKLVGKRGDEFAELSDKTVKNVHQRNFRSSLYSVHVVGNSIPVGGSALCRGLGSVGVVSRDYTIASNPGVDSGNHLSVFCYFSYHGYRLDSIDTSGLPVGQHPKAHSFRQRSSSTHVGHFPWRHRRVLYYLVLLGFLPGPLFYPWAMSFSWPG